MKRVPTACAAERSSRLLRSRACRRDP